ncbi:MAG: hypothetical protein ACI8XO_002208, partial [Verrucomicrobiales bacterium]
DFWAVSRWGITRVPAEAKPARRMKERREGEVGGLVDFIPEDKNLTERWEPSFWRH